MNSEGKKTKRGRLAVQGTNQQNWVPEERDVGNEGKTRHQVQREEKAQQEVLSVKKNE
jgi:hypothetical protein